MQSFISSPATLIRNTQKPPPSNLWRTENMTNHRYTQIIVPMGRHVRSLTPRAKIWVSVLECSLVLALCTSLVFYVHWFCSVETWYEIISKKDSGAVFFFELIFLVVYTDRVNLEWQVSCAIGIAWSTEELDLLSWIEFGLYRQKSIELNH